MKYSFSFVIYRVFDNNGNSCNEKIFNEHEAVFESFDARSAVFRGNQYTIYFYFILNKFLFQKTNFI